MRKVLLGGSIIGSLLFGGCGAETAAPDEQEMTETKDGDQIKGESKSEAWGTADNPNGFASNLEYRIASLPMSGQATKIPWAASYWPTFEDNINYKWDGASSTSAPAKFAQAFGLNPTTVENAVSSEHGIDSMTWAKTCTTASQCNSALGETCAKRAGQANGRCIQTWFGICHAWSPASIIEPEPINPVTINGVTFKVNDIKALVELSYNSTNTKFVSLRCEAGSDPAVTEAFDNYGRPTGADCRDTNPGTYHVIVTNYLGIQHASFVEDRTRNYEVWNQPMRSYQITLQQEVTAAKAAQLVTGTTTATTYSWNPAAAKFYQVRMTTRYIGESSSNTDGNLSSRIDSYTHSDNYEYVLEVDSTGKIVGGEWVGASKKAHPDFLWLPISRRGTVAGGLIDWPHVKQILDQSVSGGAGGGGGSTGTPRTVTDSGTLAKAAWKHLGPYNVASGGTLTVNMTGTGDADLYVRKGAQPTTATYDCRPYANGSNESCSVTGPGQVYVSINGYATTSNYSVTITYPEASGSGGTGGTGGGGAGGSGGSTGTVTHLNVNDSVALGQGKVFQVNVLAGRKIVARTMAANDVDMYFQMNAAPTTSAYLSRAYTSSGNETLSYTPSSNGTLYILVQGYAASSFTLTTADN